MTEEQGEYKIDIVGALGFLAEGSATFARELLEAAMGEIEHLRAEVRRLREECQRDGD